MSGQSKFKGDPKAFLKNDFRRRWHGCIDDLKNQLSSRQGGVCFGCDGDLHDPEPYGEVVITRINPIGCFLGEVMKNLWRDPQDVAQRCNGLQNLMAMHHGCAIRNGLKRPNGNKT